MVIFLTSSFIKNQSINTYIPSPIDETNGFGDNLRKYWVPNGNFLIFSSDPSDTTMGDHQKREMLDAFSLSGFSIGEIRYFDYSYIDNYAKQNNCDENIAKKQALKDALQWADVFYLSGGHVPTENAFMKECGLKELISDTEIFDGIFIGLSAGSMNAAKEVYQAPERDGESIDPSYERFTSGLDFTQINMVPHLEYAKTVTLDGRDLLNDIVAKDSVNRDIYLIPDGSYFVIRNGVTEFFGEGLIMKNGVTRPLYSGLINTDNLRFQQICPDIFEANVTDYYDWVFEFNAENGHINFFHISNFFLESGIIPVNIDTFDELNKLFSKSLIVDEEKEPYLDQIQLSYILTELESKGSYVRTIHIDTEGGIKAESLRIKKIADYDNRFLVCLKDITLILDRDWMTDEYSRSGFLTRIEQLLKQSEYKEGYSIVYSNIQGFKAINDILGMQSGDMVIFTEKDVLVDALNPVLLARLESDHFALFTKTENITEKNMDKLRDLCYVEGTKRFPFLIRCGIYNITDTTKKVAYMLDQAKLTEKTISVAHGTYYAICNNEMSQNYMTQRILVSELDGALERGEFLPYFQPIVDAKTGEIVSAEALIRWKHSERGMIPPFQFIPVFEKEGLMTKLDSFMVNSILDFNMSQIKKGQKIVPCAVNLSRVDFYDTNFLSMVKQRLHNLENVHNMLKFEITESAYAVLEADAQIFLEEMKKSKISFSLDDFGSGMSSLSTLELYEFDIIKLDMGFISKIGKNKKAEAIIRHTIGMAHDMGAKVVAEGVEYKEQLEFLQSIGCDMIQGYYFYKPMSVEEFAELL